ncbi:MAG: riboflavin synthase [bacterium]
MFTGIIRETGRLRSIEPSSGGVALTVEAPRTRPSLACGGSVAVDGVCLTVTALGPSTFRADVVPETLRRTRLGALEAGERVNLEIPLRIGDPVDGHLVQGHVDGVGVVRSVREEGNGRWVTIAVEDVLAPYLAEKGSVAVNGVSLTIAAAGVSDFSVALIPTTLDLTNLNDLREGSRVNLEVDVLARYVARRLGAEA